jgi:hypothetical protein
MPYPVSNSDNCQHFENHGKVGCQSVPFTNENLLMFGHILVNFVLEMIFFFSSRVCDNCSVKATIWWLLQRESHVSRFHDRRIWVVRLSQKVYCEHFIQLTRSYRAGINESYLDWALLSSIMEDRPGLPSGINYQLLFDSSLWFPITNWEVAPDIEPVIDWPYIATKSSIKLWHCVIQTVKNDLIFWILLLSYAFDEIGRDVRQRRLKIPINVCRNISGPIRMIRLPLSRFRLQNVLIFKNGSIPPVLPVLVQYSLVVTSR